MRSITLAGSHHEMGRQHGQQVSDLRPQIITAMHSRLADLSKYNRDFSEQERELLLVWEREAGATLEMLRGIAAGLELDWEPFFRYTIASYLDDRARAGLPEQGGPSLDQGCTTWAAAGPMTVDGQVMLAKNRDYNLLHRPLQCLARARPLEGHAYAYVTSAGSPGVFSSGMNAAGLAVTDTHVASRDMGPGVPRYAAMLRLLENCATVPEGMQLLRGMTHMGNGTLVLADKLGGMAVFETGYRSPGEVHPEPGAPGKPGDFVVSTNHYVTEPLNRLWLDHDPPELQGNSLARYRRIQAGLSQARGNIDLNFAIQLMASHGSSRDAICRHADLDPRSVTISTVIFFPAEGVLYISDGSPCRNGFTRFLVE